MAPAKRRPRTSRNAAGKAASGSAGTRSKAAAREHLSSRQRSRCMSRSRHRAVTAVIRRRPPATRSSTRGTWRPDRSRTLKGGPRSSASASRQAAAGASSSKHRSTTGNAPTTSRSIGPAGRFSGSNLGWNHCVQLQRARYEKALCMISNDQCARPLFFMHAVLCVFFLCRGFRLL